MRLRLRTLVGRQEGDTIVEVLISLAVVSLVLIGAYASTNHNVRNIQDTQEHSQALQLVQTQVEFLGANKSITGGNCFDSKGVPTNTCNFRADGSVDTTHDQPEYTLAIALNTGTCTNSYQVSASWDSLIDSSRANVSVCYRPQVAS